jgi:hypothetical protein
MRKGESLSLKSQISISLTIQYSHGWEQTIHVNISRVRIHDFVLFAYMLGTYKVGNCSAYIIIWTFYHPWMSYWTSTQFRVGKAGIPCSYNPDTDRTISKNTKIMHSWFVTAHQYGNKFYCNLDLPSNQTHLKKMCYKHHLCPCLRQMVDRSWEINTKVCILASKHHMCKQIVLAQYVQIICVNKWYNGSKQINKQQNQKKNK